MLTKAAKDPKLQRCRWIGLLDKMIAWELLKTVFAVLSVIVIIIVSRKFIKVLALAIKGTISGNTALNILGLKTVVALVNFLPAAIFMAILMVLGRMYRDNEMAAVASAGGGATRLYRAVFLLVLPLSIAASLLSLYASPWAEKQMLLLTNRDMEKADMRGLSAGHFSEYSHGDLVFYAEEINAQQQMKHIFVQNRQQGKLGIITAESGQLKELEGGKYAVLAQGERSQGLAGQANFTLESFTEYGVIIQKKSKAIRYSRESVASKSLLESEDILDQVELLRRFATPLGMIFLSLLAVPLAKLSPRGGVYGSLLFAFLIYFIYGNISRLNYSWIIKQQLPLWMGYIWVYGLLSVLTSVLLTRLYGLKWMLEMLTRKKA